MAEVRGRVPNGCAGFLMIVLTSFDLTSDVWFILQTALEGLAPLPFLNFNTQLAFVPAGLAGGVLQSVLLPSCLYLDGEDDTAHFLGATSKVAVLGEIFEEYRRPLGGAVYSALLRCCTRPGEVQTAEALVAQRHGGRLGVCSSQRCTSSPANLRLYRP